MSKIAEMMFEKVEMPPEGDTDDTGGEEGATRGLDVATGELLDAIEAGDRKAARRALANFIRMSDR